MVRLFQSCHSASKQSLKGLTLGSLRWPQKSSNEMLCSRFLLNGTIKGNVNDDVGFYNEEGTTVEFGCGVTLMGEFYYFGGYESHKRQVNYILI